LIGYTLGWLGILMIVGDCGKTKVGWWLTISNFHWISLI